MPEGFDWRRWSFDAQMASAIGGAKEGSES